jgi:hypothetical protein
VQMMDFWMNMYACMYVCTYVCICMCIYTYDWYRFRFSMPCMGTSFCSTGYDLRPLCFSTSLLETLSFKLLILFASKLMFNDITSFTYRLLADPLILINSTRSHLSFSRSSLPPFKSDCLLKITSHLCTHSAWTLHTNCFLFLTQAECLFP